MLVHALDFAPAQTNFPAKRNKCAIAAKSFHADDSRSLFRAAEGELRLVALFPTHELFAQWRLRGDDEDFLFVVNDFRAAGARAEEVKRIFAAVLQFHQRPDVNGLAVRELARGQLFKFSDGGFDFRRLPGLAAGEVGGFEAAGVVFVLGLVLFVRGFGARSVRGAEINLQFLCEPADDFSDKRAFVHGWRLPHILSVQKCAPNPTTRRKSSGLG